MGTSELDGSGRARSGSDRASPLAANRPGIVEPSDDVRVMHHVAWPGLTRPLDEVVAAPSGLWIVEHRPWQDVAVARGRVITADADVTLDVQHLDQVRVRVARDLGLAPVEAHALVVVPEEVPALRLEGVVIVGQRLVRQIILSPGRRLTPTQLDVLARRTSKVLGHAAPDRPQAPPGVTLVPDSVPGPAAQPAPAAERPASSPFNRRPSSGPAPPRAAADGPHEPQALPEPVLPILSTEPVPEPTAAAPGYDAEPTPPAPEPEPLPPVGTPPPELLDLGAAPTEHHDEPPPPLPTPEEMGLRPALSEPPVKRQAASVDPIWPIAPPPGMWSDPEPEPELARLVTSADTDPVYLDEGEFDLERTRVVESTSTVPEVDDDESEMGRTRVVDAPTSHPVTSRRGLPRLVELDAAEPGPWPEPTTSEELISTDSGLADLGPVDTEPVDTEMVDPGLVEPDVAEPSPWPDPAWPTPLHEPTTSEAPADPASPDAGPVDLGPADSGSVDPEPIDPELIAELIATGMIDPGMLAELIDAQLVEPESIDPALFDAQPVAEAGPVGEDDRDRPFAQNRTDQTAPRPAASDERSRPPEVYQALDEDVELTRIRPPDRPAASPSLADARRAFFSGAGDSPVTAFSQTPEEETVQAAEEAPSHHGRNPVQARPAARLPVAWDDDPPSDGSRPHVAWDPPETPRRSERPQVAWDDPASAVTEPEPEAPRPERRSVVAGPRPPADHRPIEHTERPAQPVERPSRYRSGPQIARPAVLPDESSPSPPQEAVERHAVPAPRGPVVPQRPPRPRAVRTGPWNLSPAQAAAVGGRFPGPARIRGAFGTGRSVVAAYRAVHLAQTRSGMVAIVVPASAQIEPMRRRLASVADTDVLERIVVDVPAGIAQALLAEFGTEVDLAPESVARAWSVAQRSTGLGAAQGRSIGLLLDEVALIRGRSLTDKGDYTRLRQEIPSGLRHQVWVLHEAYLAELRQQNLPDEHDLVRMARAALRAGVPSELTAVVVDDANDLTPDQLMMLRETVGTGMDALTVVDDGLPGLLPVGATLGEVGIDIAQRQVDLAHEFRLTGPAWTSLVRLLQGDTGRDVAGTTDRPRLAGRMDSGEGPAYLRSQAIRLRRDRLVERVAELIAEGVPPESIALLHVEDEPEPELVAELIRAGVLVRGLDALAVPGVALGRARDARGVEFDHVLVPDARHRDVVPVGGLRWDQRQRRRLLGLALSRSRETAWIAGV